MSGRERKLRELTSALCAYTLDRNGCCSGAEADNLALELETLLAELPTAPAPADELWRKLLWNNHARYLPFEHTPYGDDGEMQCCGIDFKRMSAEEIDKVLVERSLHYNLRPATAGEELRFPDWICQHCSHFERGGLGKPTICSRCGWNKW